MIVSKISLPRQALKVVASVVVASLMISLIATSPGSSAFSGETDSAGRVIQLHVGQKGYTADGTEKEADVAPFIENGRTFVPVRFVAEELNMKADWGPKEGLTEWVSFEKGNLEIELTINSPNMAINENGNERTTTSDVAPQIRDGRTFLPLRAVGEILGAEFDWGPKDGETEWVEFRVGFKDEDEKRSEDDDNNKEEIQTIVQVKTLDQVANAIADESIDVIELMGDIDIEGGLTVKRSVSIDFGSYTLDGDVAFEHEKFGVSELLSDPESKDASISGDLTIDTPNASFVNNVKVGGTVLVQAVEPNSYTENANGNSITIRAKGVTITINGNPGDVQISGLAGDIVIYIAEGAEVDIDVHGSAKGVTLVTAKDSKITLTGDGADTLKIEGDGEAKKKEDPPPMLGGGGGGGAPPPSNSGDTGEGDTGGTPPPSNGGDTGGGTGNGSSDENGSGGTEDPDEYEVIFIEGNNLAGVEIAVDGEDTVTTNATGEAVIDLKDGQYDFTASLADHNNYEGSFAVDSSAVTVNFEMVETIEEPAVYSVMFNETNELEGVNIQVYLDADRTVEKGDPFFSNSSGEAEKELESGDYWFEATLPGHEDYTGAFSVADDGKVIEYTLIEEFGEISGSVVYSNVDINSLSWASVFRASDPSGLGGDTEAPDYSESDGYLVGFNPDASVKAKTDTKNAIKLDIEKEVYAEFDVVDSVAVEMSHQDAIDLVKDPTVEYIEPDSPVYALEQTTPVGTRRVYGEEEYSFPTWDISDGSGMGVAVLDSGIDIGHSDLPTPVKGINTIDGTPWSTDPDGHGTHVAGTIVAIDNNYGIVGVAPGADLYIAKVLNDSGNGTISSVINGIDWAVNENVPIINMSLGTSTYSVTWNNACDNAYSQGHLLVAAAGNLGNAGPGGSSVACPARFDSVMAVSASTVGNNLASFSSTGSDVEFVAIGQGVYSTTTGGGYGLKSGTSMAAPHVTGVAAVVWGANPDLTNDQIRNLLADTAEDIGLPAEQQGNGMPRADIATREIVGWSLADTEIALSIDGGSGFTVSTDENGEYLIEGVEPGVHDITISVDGYQDATIEGVVVIAEQETTGVNWHLYSMP